MTARKKPAKVKLNKVHPGDSPEVFQTLRINYKDEKFTMISEYFYRGSGDLLYLSSDPKLAGGFSQQEISRMFVDGKFVTNKVCNLLHKALLSVLLSRNLGEFSLTIHTYEFQHFETKQINGITSDLDYALNGNKYIESIMKKLTDNERAFLDFKGVSL